MFCIECQNLAYSNVKTWYLIFYLRIHSSTSAGSQTFSTVQFEYQYGKFPFTNILPFGHLYFENSLSYQSHPPSIIGGGCSGQGSTKIFIEYHLVFIVIKV